jgi:hypothetical protein
MGWITVDFRPAPAPVMGETIKKVKTIATVNTLVLGWKCLYLTGMHNTPYMDIPLAGWLIQRDEERMRVVAGVVMRDGTVRPWDEEFRLSNGVHTARYPWCVIEPLAPKDWPSKDAARKRWQEIQGSIIIEESQE